MSFRFKILSAVYLPVAGICALDGVLESGTILTGSEGTIEELSQRLRVKSVALVNSPTVGSNRFTLSIELPPISLAEIKEGMTFVGHG